MSADWRYRRALGRLAALLQFGVRPGLETITRLCARLGQPQLRVPALHIAGTNGKGSTAAFAESLLRQGGARVGLYTSPHLLRFTERIRIDGVEVAPGRCAELLERAFAAAEAEGLTPTFFEVATAAALLAFAEADLDLAVIECGLGGRLDATTVCSPLASVITGIGLDHTEVLGETLAQIAREKVGIARAGVPLVVGAVGGEALAVIEARAAELGIAVALLGRDFSARHHQDRRGSRLDYRGPGGPLDDAELGLQGAHQAHNAAVALAAVALLTAAGPLAATIEAGDETRRRGLAQVWWPGRLERLAPDLRVDGAHNGDGALALAAALAEGTPVTLLLGLLADKDAGAVLAALLPIASALVCTRPASPRALPAADLAGLARRVAASLGRPGLSIAAEDDVVAALALARAAGAPVVACGSLYLVGQLRALVGGEAADPTMVSDPGATAKLEGARRRD